MTGDETMQYTISYYGQTRRARTAPGAIRAAKRLVKLYGQGNKIPRIEAATQADADELEKTMRVAEVHYSLHFDGQPVI
jgi:hypothetical protein